MLSAKTPLATQHRSRKAAPPPAGTHFVGCRQEFITVWLPALFSSHLPLYATRHDARGVNRDGCNRDATGIGRKGARSCCTSRGQRCGEGRRRIRGAAERGQQERALKQLHFANAGCRPPPPRSWAVAGLLPHGAAANEASAPFDSLHLLPLASSCQAPGSRRAPGSPALAARCSRPPPPPPPPELPRAPPGPHPGVATRRGLTLPREGKHPEMPCK